MCPTFAFVPIRRSGPKEYGLTDQATRVVPAGWYEDPASSAHVRWWNGLAWTEHTTLKPTAPPRPQPTAGDYRQQQGYGQPGNQQQGYGQQDAGVVTTATGSTYTPETLARIAEARELERQYGISTAEHEIMVRSATAATGGIPTATTRAEARAAHGSHARDDYADTDYPDEYGTATASAWFIALWPLLTLAAAAAAAYVAFYVAPEPSVAGIPVVAGLVVVPTLLTLLWAATDARKLRMLGHRPASPAFALLGPLVYLIARRARVSGSGPLVTLLVLTVLAVGGPAAAYLTGATVPVTTALEIQQSIRADLVDSGRLASVSCPVFVEDLSPGALYTCNGTMPDGSAKTVWVSIESTDGDFSYALAVR